MEPADQRHTARANERQAILAELQQCRTPLTVAQEVQLRRVFHILQRGYEGQVWMQLSRRGLLREEIEDISQEVFLTVFGHVRGHGFPVNFAGLVVVITTNQLLNHLTVKERVPYSFGLPSSSLRNPNSGLDTERRLATWELSQKLLREVDPKHHDVIETVVLNGLLYDEAAQVLGIPIDTLKSRLTAAKKALYEAASRILPPSQRTVR